MKVPKEYECPICQGGGYLCNNPGWGEDYCPEGHEDCTDPCESLIECEYCKGDGMVTFAKMNRHAKKMASNVWGMN